MISGVAGAGQGDAAPCGRSLTTHPPPKRAAEKKYHVGIKEPPPGDKSGGGFLFAPQHQPQGQEQRKMECNAMAFPKQVYRHNVQLSSSSQSTTARRGRRGRVRGPAFRAGRINSSVKPAVTVSHFIRCTQLLFMCAGELGHRPRVESRPLLQARQNGKNAHVETSKSARA